MIIAIPEALREKLGPEGAQALAELLNEARVQTRGDVIEIAASRFERRLAEELAAVRADIEVLRAEVGSEIEALRSDMRLETGKIRAEMDAKFGAFEARITRWMFVFWIGQIGALLGILFAFFRT